jgi:hypothetical protein
MKKLNKILNGLIITATLGASYYFVNDKIVSSIEYISVKNYNIYCVGYLHIFNIILFTATVYLILNNKLKN